MWRKILNWLNPLNDWKLKLLAAGLTAFLCWVIQERMAPVEGDEILFKEVSISIICDKSSIRDKYWIDDSTPNKTCRVSFHSPENYLEKNAKIQISLTEDDFQNLENGRISVPFKQEYLMLREEDSRVSKRASDPNAKVSKISFFPGSVEIPADIIVKNKFVKVEPVYNLDELPAGYRLSDIQIDNTTPLAISGPKHVIDSVSALPTEPISLAGKTANFTIPIKLDDNLLPGCELSRSSVRVSVKIEQQKPEKFTYDLFVMQSSDQTGKLKIAEALPKVTLTVSKEENDLSEHWFHPYIDISPFKGPGTYEVPVQYSCEPGKKSQVQDCSVKKLTIVLEKADN